MSPAARRSAALSRVRGTCHGSVSPNAHGRVAPVGSPAAPDAAGLALAARGRRSGRRRRAARTRPADAAPSGDSRSDPSGIRSNRPWRRSSRSSSASARASTRAWSPSAAASASRSMSSSRAPGIGLRRAARPARPAGPAPPSPGWPRPCPAGCRRGTGPATSQSSPGRSALQLRVELGQRLRQPRIAERLLRQLRQLGPLLGRHRVQHPLRGGGPLRRARRSARRCSAGSPGRTRRAGAMNSSNCSLRVAAPARGPPAAR